MATGFSLNIDNDLLKNLEKADELVQDIGKHSEQTRDMFNNAFQSMATGSLDGFISKLMRARQAIQDIGDAKVSDKGLGSISTQAVQGADSVNNLVESITRLMQVVRGKKAVQLVDVSSLNTAEEKVEQLRHLIAEQETFFRNHIDNLSRTSLPAQQYKHEMAKMKEFYEEQAKVANMAEKQAEKTALKREKALEKERKLAEKAAAMAEKQAEKERKLAEKAAAMAEKQAEKERKLAEAKELAVKEEKRKTFEGAMDFSKSTKSIKDQIQAIKYLKAARENLSKEGMSEADYRKKVKELTDEIKRQQKEVDKLVGKNSALGKSHKSLINTADQLKRAFALIFSVSAIRGYVTEIARVRGEFELQQRSLQAILQNKDEADRLWQQTIQLAVRSPFQVKELVTYTKQLAAYRVESDKLYDTTKMLADVSAGLGVDMNRLILAYGQVKAANYLRGCLGKGTKVQMFNGSVKNVEDIVVGDIILGDDNTERVVSEIIRGREQMYKVCSKDGLFNEYRVNENHILTLFDIEEQKNVDVYVTKYLENPNRYLGATQKGVYDIVVTKDIVDDYYGFVIDKNKRFVIENGIITHNTELRQFSEAGVNILEELAKYFSELEGRAVSVGDVFERVSKRMVTFADVEEIFKRITSEGGVFYNMQEVQAETLKGQISNLRDAIDIMLNEIGKDNEGVLKGTVSTLRELVSSWREVEFYLSKVIVAYATYKGAVGIASLANSSFANGLLDIITKSDTATKAFDKLSNGIENVLSKLFKSQAAIPGIKAFLGGLATLGVTAAIAAIAVGLMELWRRATKTTRELKALNKELEQIYSQDTKALDKQIKGFENLVNRLKTVNKGSREHKDIIGALNQNYGEYLGFIVDETTSYQRLERSINAVNLALTNKAKLNTYEKAYGKVLEKNNEIISERQSTIKKQLEKVDVLKAGDIIQLNENEINDIFALFEKKVADAGRTGYDLAKEAFKEYGVEIEYGDIFNWGVFTEYGEAVLRNKEEEIKLQNKINSLYGGATASTIEMRQELERINAEEKNALANAETRRKKEEVRLKYAKERIDAEVKYEGLGADAAAKRYAELEKKSKTVIDVNEKIAKSVNKLGEKYADLIYIDDEQSAQGIDSIAKSAAESYELQNAIIDSQNKLKDAGTVYDKEALDNANKSAAAYEYLLKLLGREDLIKEAKVKRQKKQNAEQNKELSLLNKQIQALKEANKQYEKLKQTREETVAATDVSKAFSPLFKELGIEKLMGDKDFSKSGIYEALNKLPNYAGEKGKKALEEIKAIFKSEIDLDLEITGLNDLKKEINKKFENYQLYVELSGLGLPKDLMKRFYADIIDLNELKDFAKTIERVLIGYGDKGIEVNKNMNDKILQMDAEYAKKRVETYVKYLMEAQREAVKIKVEELRKLKEIEESKEFSPEQKQEIKDRVRKETNAELQKQEWADFQNSEMYTMMFEDLEHYGTQALETLRHKLEELKGSLTDLPASEVKEIINQLSKIEDITIERNPFRALKDARDKIIKEGISEEKAQTNLAKSENEIAKLQSELDIINIVNTAKSKGLAIDKETQYAYDDILVEMADKGVAEAEIVKSKEKSLKTEKDNAQAAKTTLENYERQGKARVAALNKTKDILGSVQDATKASMELMDSLGVSTDSVAYSLAEGVDGMISLTLSAIEFGIQMETLGYQSNMALGIIGWVAIGIQAVATAISAIFKMHDKGLQNQIDKLAVQTEDLQEKFDALNESIDNAYNTDQLRIAAAEAKKYTEQMIRNYERMIALEEEKKKTDKDKVEEYKENIKEQTESLRDLEKDIVSEVTAGIFDNVTDAARDFVDAWYDSFKEVGNGLKGLEDNFEEMFLNLAKQQATMQIAGRFAKQWEKDLSKYINETDTELTKAEAQKWAEEVKATFPALNDALEGFLGVITEGVGATGELSGLEQGIAGASEETVQVVAAYLNSLRFFVADNNSVMKQLRDYIIGTEENANPMLAQLRIIAQQTSAMRTLLDSVTQSGHPKGQSGIRVFID